MAAVDPETLSADVLVAPSRGAVVPSGVRGNDARFAGVLRSEMDEIMATMLKSAKVRDVVVEFGNPRPVLKDGRDAQRAHDIAKTWYEEQVGAGSVYGTDTHGAIFVVSDGTSYKLSTMADRNRLADEGDTQSLAEIEM
jgi:hypothetical protein